MTDPTMMRRRQRHAAQAAMNAVAPDVAPPAVIEPKRDADAGATGSAEPTARPKPSRAAYMREYRAKRAKRI